MQDQRLYTSLELTDPFTRVYVWVRAFASYPWRGRLKFPPYYGKMVLEFVLLCTSKWGGEVGIKVKS